MISPCNPKEHIREIPESADGRLLSSRFRRIGKSLGNAWNLAIPDELAGEISIC